LLHILYAVLSDKCIYGKYCGHKSFKQSVNHLFYCVLKIWPKSCCTYWFKNNLRVYMLLYMYRLFRQCLQSGLHCDAQGHTFSWGTIASMVVYSLLCFLCLVYFCPHMIYHYSFVQFVKWWTLKERTHFTVKNAFFVCFVADFPFLAWRDMAEITCFDIQLQQVFNIVIVYEVQYIKLKESQIK